MRHYNYRAVTPTTNQPGFWQTIGDQIPGLARGAYSGLLGLPGDVEEMTVSAAPYALLSQGKISPQRFSNLATQDYSPGLLTSEEIADPLRKEGLLSKRPLEGEYTELAGMFLSPDMFVGDIAKLGALGVGASIFTSPAQKAVREVAKDALPSQQWLKQLEGRGVKKDELEWTGLLNFLKGKKGNIQKSEVEDFIEANKIDVREVVKGGNEGVPLDWDTIGDIMRKHDIPGDIDPLENEVEFAGRIIKEYGEKLSPEETDYLSKGILSANQTDSALKFSQPAYQLPGGENYRELVLTLPNTRLEKAGRELAEFEAQFKSKPIPDQYWGEEKRLRQAIADAKDEAGTFTGTHFPEDNILSWVRFNERVDPDGNKVLFIEEIQSDWAQKGRKVGFISPESKKIWKEKDIVETKMNNISEERRTLNESLTDEMIDDYEADLEIFAKHHNLDPSEARHLDTPEAVELRRKHDPVYDKREVLNKKYDDLEKERDQLLRDYSHAPGGNIPTAPFLEDTNQWAGLSMKRMIKWASDEGFDSIAWTTGKQQAARYDLSKQISEIHYQGTDFTAFDHSGNRVIQQTGVRKEDLPDLIGKEVAEKLMKQPNTAPTTSRYQQRSLKGQDLEVGGEGMAGFYDKILVDQANKIGKKYGAKVKEGGLKKFASKYSDTKGDKIWTMKLPDKLKEAAKEGLPYYALVPPGLLAVGAQRERQSLLE